MQTLLDLFHQLTDVRHLVQVGGYVGLTAIIFAETGLLIGFFLPGDSLLVTAGLLAAQPQFGLNVWLLGLLLTVAAILGNSLGYLIGRYSGPRLFTRDDSLLFKKKHLFRAQEFYTRHGGKTLVIARFMPIVRTFVPVVAGMAQMNVRVYTAYNVLGAVLWIWSMLFIGYFLGRFIPGVDQHIEKVILLVIFLSLLPGLISWWRERKRSTADSSVQSTTDA
ncbi:MAG: DedA family protein [Gemmatimonadaceae bacterium]|nr:DedA family protein [Gemmatimonadaceae bacterium]NUO94559.1 DedA family protein [Gemmatimonadaceae bacterium]NUP55574.1 DedA family protein [Gemmatimonadaceae bacterium]NUP70117.1 DedA family protein [Gemmatimonadaceae bacterium]NUR33641.1 DedA family protein [Gemmatimonadaceae bacterium]